MTRHRWLRADWPITIRALAKRLKKIPFDDDSDEGFVIDRVNDNYLEARYVEKISFKDHVVDPFGRELVFDRVEFTQVTFKATARWPGLELIEAPRASRGLISRLGEATEFKVAISPIQVDVLLWARLFQAYTNLEGVINSLQIGALQLAPGVTAKVLVKGTTDIQEACKKLTAERRYSIEKIQVQSGSIQTILTNSGTAKISASSSEGTIDALRESLFTACTSADIK